MMYTLISNMGITPINTDYQSDEIPKTETKYVRLVTDQNLEDAITFIESPSECCVGIVDIVGSTKATARLPYSQVGKYYGVFLNTMTVIVKRFGGIVVKNGGDSLLYYFQETPGYDKSIFIRCFECSLAMIDAHNAINTRLRQEKLPALDFRVSADYGKVTLATSSNSTYHDIFGSPVNFCSKINSKAAPNTVVVGGDLRQMAKGLRGYAFKEEKSFSVGFKLQYPIYTVFRNNEQYVSMIEFAIRKALLDMSPLVLDTVSLKLANKYGCQISDCNEHPHLLKNILDEIFGNASSNIMKTIKDNLSEHTRQLPIAVFLEQLEKL